MLITSLTELNQVREECKSMVTKRAAASSFAAIIPIPGTDIVADVGMLMTLLPEINKKFGLSNEQIEQLDEPNKIFIAQMIKKVGSLFAGKVITKELIMQLLKGMAKRIAVKQIVKYIPFVGQAAAAAISFAVMKYVGNSHVEECYAIIKCVLEKRGEQPWIEVAETLTEDNNCSEPGNISKKEIMETLKMLKELLESGVISEDEFQEKKKELLSRL